MLRHRKISCSPASKVAMICVCAGFKKSHDDFAILRSDGFEQRSPPDLVDLLEQLTIDDERADRRHFTTPDTIHELGALCH